MDVTHSRTDTVGNAVTQGHEYGGMQLESNHVLGCKVGKTALSLLALKLKRDGKRNM